MDNEKMKRKINFGSLISNLGQEADIYNLKDDPSKIVRASKPDSTASDIERFKKESERLQQILGNGKHEGLVQLFEIGQVASDTEALWSDDTDFTIPIPKGTPFQVMEKCDAGDLSEQKLAGESLSEIITIFKDVLYGINNLQELGVVQHDLKEENILLKTGGHAVLADFGSIAKLGNKNDGTGSFAYFSPERCDPEKTISIEQEIYSLGMTMAFSLLPGARLQFIKTFPNSNEEPMKFFAHQARTNGQYYQEAFTQLYQQLDSAKINPALCQLIKEMTSFNANDRPTIEQCLAELNRIEKIAQKPVFVLKQ